MIEIERRFLVRDPGAALAGTQTGNRHQISQGYFGRIDGLRLRVRITTDESGDSRPSLTLKGPRQGLCRVEYRSPLDLHAAQRALRTLPADRIIRKHRYYLRHDDGLTWAIDCFHGGNAGLVVAEVELARADQVVDLPDWVGDEVTSDCRYGNSHLAYQPISAFARAA